VDEARIAGLADAGVVGGIWLFRDPRIGGDGRRISWDGWWRLVGHIVVGRRRRRSRHGDGVEGMMDELEAATKRTSSTGSLSVT
jgi:hypothetical protein